MPWDGRSIVFWIHQELWPVEVETLLFRRLWSYNLWEEKRVKKKNHKKAEEIFKKESIV